MPRRSEVGFRDVCRARDSATHGLYVRSPKGAVVRAASAPRAARRERPVPTVGRGPELPKFMS